MSSTQGIAIAYQLLLFAKVTIISMLSNKKSENKPLKVLFLPVSDAAVRNLSTFLAVTHPRVAMIYTLASIHNNHYMHRGDNEDARAGICIIDARFRRPAAIATRAMPRHAATMWHCARHEP